MFLGYPIHVLPERLDRSLIFEHVKLFSLDPPQHALNLDWQLREIDLPTTPWLPCLTGHFFPLDFKQKPLPCP